MTMISTKGRYALRVMIDLAQHNSGEYIILTDIAKRQDISEKYLESIVSLLSKNNIVDSLRGKGGGYRLNKPASEYKVIDILLVTEGSLAPVACLENKTKKCLRSSDCKTLKLWTGLDNVIKNYFSGITIADLVNEKY